jgi:hypothetical protein
VPHTKALYDLVPHIRTLLPYAWRLGPQGQAAVRRGHTRLRHPAPTGDKSDLVPHRKTSYDFVLHTKEESTYMAGAWADKVKQRFAKGTHDFVTRHLQVTM